MKTRKSGNSNPVMLGIVFTLAGALILYFFGWPQFKYAYDSKNWPTTTGTITESKVESWMKDGSSVYDARITFTYMVEGKKYSSSKTNTSGSYTGGNITRAKEIVAEYPMGKTVDVYYDPEVPGSGSLKPGLSGKDIAITAIPLLFFILGLLVLFRVIKPRPSNVHSHTHGKTDASKVINNILRR